MVARPRWVVGVSVVTLAGLLAVVAPSAQASGDWCTNEDGFMLSPYATPVFCAVQTALFSLPCIGEKDPPPVQ